MFTNETRPTSSFTNEAGITPASFSIRKLYKSWNYNDANANYNTTDYNYNGTIIETESNYTDRTKPNTNWN